MVTWILQQTYSQDKMIVPPLKGLNKCVPIINPGLAPWAIQEYRPLGAHCPTAPINPTNNPPIPQTIQPQSNKYKNTTERNNSFTHPKTHLTNTIPQTPNTTKSPARATPPQSPGWNEGKARYGTLGKHRQKRIELRRSGTYPSTQMPQRINTIQHNNHTQYSRWSAAPKGAQ